MVDTEVSGEYQAGGLSQLIGSKSKATKTKKTKAASAEKLETVFNDPTASEYAVKPVEKEEDTEETAQESEIEKKRREVREKSKLSKLRRQEKEATGHRTVFVGNLPIKTTKKDLLKFFEKYGKIESVRFRNLMRKDLTKPMKVSAIKKDLHPLAKNMNAYIQFEEVKSATRALKRNGKELLGSQIRVDIAGTSEQKHDGRDRKSTVFIGNMPFDASEQELRTHFADCGDIVNVRIIRDQETRLGKGFGYVQFKSPDGVHLALQMDGNKFGKNKLRVQRCVLQAPKEKPADEQDQHQSWSGSMSTKGQKPNLKGKKSFTADVKPKRTKKKPRHENRHDRNKVKKISQPEPSSQAKSVKVKTKSKTKVVKTKKVKK